MAVVDKHPGLRSKQAMNARRVVLSCLLAALAPYAARAAIDLDSGDYLSWNTAPATATPLTMYCRFSLDIIVNSGDAAGTHVSIAENGNHSDGSFTIGDNGFGQFRAYAGEAGGFSIAAIASPTITTATWNHGFGRFESSTSRWAQLNADAVQSTVSRTPAGLNGVRVGATNPGPQQFVGQIAEVCIWNVTLSSDERDAIRNGARPCAVQPSAVVFYCSGLSTTAEIGGAPSETGTPTIVSHPSVVYVTRAMAHAKRR